MMSTFIMSTPEGLVVTGDLCPGHHGVVSSFGYTWEWFASDLSESYLCEKFLQKGYVAELAYRQVMYLLNEDLADVQSAESKRKLQAAKEALEQYGDTPSQAELHEVLTEADMAWDGIGHHYDPVDAGWLCAIQQRFAALIGGVRGAA